MRFSISTSTLVTITFLVWTTIAIPASQADEVQFGQGGVVRAGEDMQKRKDLPDQCNFNVGDADYWYLPLNRGSEAFACIAGPTEVVPGVFCPGDSYWPQNNVDDFLDAAKEQIPKDGPLTKSTKGNWMAHWIFPPTTAVADQQAYWNFLQLFFISYVPSCDIVPECNTRSRRYYYQYDSDVSRPPFCMVVFRKPYDLLV